MSDPTLKAWGVRSTEWPEAVGITAHKTRDGARYRSFRAGQEADCNLSFISFRARRLPALDSWAKEQSGDWSWIPDAVPGGTEALATIGWCAA